MTCKLFWNKKSLLIFYLRPEDSFLAFKTQNAARTVFWVWHAGFIWSCHQWVGVVRKTWYTNWRYHPTYPLSECWSTCTGSSACSSSVEEKFNQTKAKVGSTGSANNRDPSDRKNRTGDVSADEWVLIFLFLICCWYYEKTYSVLIETTYSSRYSFPVLLFPALDRVTFWVDFDRFWSEPYFWARGKNWLVPKTNRTWWGK